MKTSSKQNFEIEGCLWNLLPNDFWPYSPVLRALRATLRLGSNLDLPFKLSKSLHPLSNPYSLIQGVSLSWWIRTETIWMNAPICEWWISPFLGGVAFYKWLWIYKKELLICPIFAIIIKETIQILHLLPSPLPWNFPFSHSSRWFSFRRLFSAARIIIYMLVTPCG